MGQLITYLTFNGSCREAMEFYQQCLGGVLRFQTLDESPKTEKLPTYVKEYILHASLKKNNLVLMGTDLTDEKLMRGNAVSILLDCKDENRIRIYYKKLEVDGKATYPLQDTHSGELFGGLTDKFGNRWLFRMKR